MTTPNDHLRGPSFKIQVITLFLICFVNNSLAQSLPIDSLRAQLRVSKVDTIRVQLLNALAYEFRSVNTDSTLYYANKAYELSTDIDYIRGSGQSLASIAIGYHVKGKLDTAALLYESAIPLVESVNDQKQLSSLYNNLGLIRWNWGNYIKAIELFQKSLSMDEALDDISGQASVLNNIGLIYRSLKEYDMALQNYNRSLDILSKLNDNLRMGQILNNIGAVMSDLDQPDSALFKYKTSLKYLPEGNCYAANPILGIARVFFAKGQSDSVLYYSDRAIAVASKCGMAKLRNSAEAFRGDAHSKKGDYVRAEKILIDAYDFAKSKDLLDNQKMILDMIYHMYRAKGDYKAALTQLNGYYAVSEELLNNSKVKELARLEAQYEADKEKLSLMAEQERERLIIEADREAAETAQRWTIIVAVILAFFLSVVTWGLWQRRRSSIKLALLNNELNDINERLRQHDDYRTRTFANINHDFRTPLTLIRGYVDRILSSKTNYLTNESEQDLTHLKENTTVLTNMTEEIQSLILLDEGKLKVQWNEIDLVHTLTTIVQMYHSMADVQGKTLELHADDKFKIHADLMHFKKILYNIVSNAFRHTLASDNIDVFLEDTGEGAEIKVQDTGKGISSEYLPYIFDRFYQAPDNDYKSKEGFGIGLTLAKELVELHGGAIEVESEPDKGTTFTIYMPYNLDKEVIVPDEVAMSLAPLIRPSAEDSAINEPLTDTAHKQHTLLVVDDHEEIRHYIANTLSQGYRVRQAAHGKEALEILEKEKIDLIITDLMMPWLDGFELIEQVTSNEKWDHIPMMVVSARTTEKDKRKVLNTGINDFISKPFDTIELMKRVENQIGVLDKAKENTWQAVSENKEIRSNLEQSILKKINQLIIERIEDPSLRVEDIAAEICASQRKTYNLLKSLTGQSPKSHIKDIRLNYVHQLIKKGKINSASEAARAIGMKNGTEFKNQYMNKFGVPPFS